MPSPDWSAYVDLTPFDLDADAILDEAIEYARTLLPEWTPAAGETEVVLLEAIATEVANAVAAANRVPSAVTETLLKLFDVERSDGTKSTATVTFTADTTTGYSLSSGTKLAFFPPASGQPLVYALTDDLNIPSGSASAVVDVVAAEVGMDHNEPQAGDSLQVLANTPWVVSAVFTTSPSGGAAAETDDEYFARALATLASYTTALVTPTQIAAHVLTAFPSIAFRAVAHDQRRSTDRDTTNASYTTHPGRVLVVVSAKNHDPADTSDVEVSLTDRNAISDALAERVVASLIPEVAPVEIVDVDVTATVVSEASANAAVVTAAIEDALTALLQPNSWPWRQVVRTNEIASLIDSISGVDYVSSVVLGTSGAATVDGSGNLVFDLLGSLPEPGTFDITVT